MSATEKPDIRRFSPWFLYSRIFAIFLLLVPLTAAIYQPGLMQGSDFLMTFYIAGKLVLAGRASDIYPPFDATSWLSTPFNQYAHQILTALPARTTAIYMYSPLTAAVFVPFGALDPQTALVCWQVASVAAIAACAWLFAQLTGRSFGSFFWMSILFFPTFDTLLIGHLGIILGMLPLALGFFLATRNRPWLAGFCWALLLLKPQLLPSAFVIAGALALIGRWQCAAGLVSGMVALGALSIVSLSPTVTQLWLHSFSLTDTILSDARYGYPKYLVCSMPGVIVQAVPFAWRSIAKLVTYGAAAAIGLHCVWFARNLLKKHPDTNAALPMVFVISIFVLPLVLPHFLFYDMCVFALVGMVIFGYRWASIDISLRSHAIVGWIVCDLYLILWMFVSKPLSQPIVLVACAAWLYVRILGFMAHSESPLPFAAGNEAKKVALQDKEPNSPTLKVEQDHEPTDRGL
jgi:hypothetical protein